MSLGADRPAVEKYGLATRSLCKRVCTSVFVQAYAGAHTGRLHKLPRGVWVSMRVEVTTSFDLVRRDRLGPKIQIVLMPHRLVPLSHKDPTSHGFKLTQ